MSAFFVYAIGAQSPDIVQKNGEESVKVRQGTMIKGKDGTITDLSITINNNPNDLVSALVAPNSGITVTSVNFTGDPTAAGLYTGGPFYIDDGIILATGNVTNALPPNNYPDATTDFGLPGCPWCDSIIPGYPSYDAAYLEITFDLNESCSGIAFDFIFGSEEYPEYVGSSYNDVYGAYINGLQMSFDEFGNPVTINSTFFSGPYVQTPPLNGMEYDGSTFKLASMAPVDSGSSNNSLIFAICDAGDHLYDSGVLLANLRGLQVDTIITGIPPEFVRPPTPDCFSAFEIDAGQNLTFDVQAVDNGINGDLVTLSALNIPSGATMTPGLPAVGNPVSSTFSWTPDLSQGGIYSVQFAIHDSIEGLGSTCQIDIIVNATTIPTLSEWGMLILALLLLAAGTIALVRRKKTVQVER